MSLIRRFVNMNYCSEDEAILVPDSDSDIPPRAQAMGLESRLHSEQASTLVWKDIWNM